MDNNPDLIALAQSTRFTLPQVTRAYNRLGGDLELTKKVCSAASALPDASPDWIVNNIDDRFKHDKRYL